MTEAGFSTQRLLIVDDEAVVTRPLARLMRRYFLDVAVAHTVPDAIRALDLAQTTGQPFHAIILDLVVGDSSGELVIDHSDALPLRPTIVAMTGADHMTGRVWALRGRCEFLPKPCDVEDLLEVLKPDVPEPLLRACAADHALSDRELEVLEKRGRGLTDREVAEDLRCRSTVHTYLDRIARKVGAESRSEILGKAIQWADRRDARQSGAYRVLGHENDEERAARGEERAKRRRG